MSSNNNEVNGTMLAVAMVGAAAFVLFAFVFAVAAFITIILTVLCILAWNKTLTLGKLTLEPADARAFIIRGILGAIILAAFAAFSSALFSFEIRDDYWEYIYLGGYVGGSLGLAVLGADDDTPAPDVEILPPLPKVLPPPAPSAQPKPFQFASWDDEDARS